MGSFCFKTVSCRLNSLYTWICLHRTLGASPLHCTGTSGLALVGGKSLPTEVDWIWGNNPKPFLSASWWLSLEINLDRDHTTWGQNQIRPVCRVMRPSGFCMRPWRCLLRGRSEDTEGLMRLEDALLAPLGVSKSDEQKTPWNWIPASSTCCESRQPVSP